MSLLNKLIKILLVVNSAVLLVPDKFKAIPISLLFVLIVVRSLKLKVKIKLFTKGYIVSILFYLIYIASFFYSEDKTIAFKKIETTISLLIFPTMFYLLAGDKEILSKKIINFIKLSFIASVFIFISVSFTYYYFTEPHYTFNSILVHYSNLVNIRTTYFRIHPIYLSISVGLSIIFSVTLIKKNSLYKLILPFCTLFFIVFLSILNKKGPIISLVIVGLFFLFKNRISYKKSILILLSFIILIGFISYLPKYNNINVYNELIGLVKNTNEDNTSTSIRLKIYECSLSYIYKSPFLGYGLGDVNNLLHTCYSYKTNYTSIVKYNSHNQYFSFFLASGFLGVLAFLYYLIFLLKIGKNTDLEILSILSLYFFLNMLTENILEREDGVIIFSFLINLFLFKNKKLC